MISARTLIASALLLCTSLASANATTYKQSIVREELVLTKYKQPYLDLVDINRREALQSWYRLFFSSPDNKRKYMTARARLNSYVMGEEFSKLIMYYVMTGQNESAIQTLGLYLLSSYTLLESHTLDPFNVHYGSTALNALDIIEKYSIKDITSIETCVRGVLKDSKRSYDITKSQLVPNFISSCLRSNYFIHDLNRIVEALTQSTDYRGAPHTFSFSTPIGGNKVQLLNKVPMADFAIEFLGKQLHAIHNNVNKALNKKYAQMSVEDFKSVMTSEEDAVDNLFTRAEGFANREAHYSLGPVSAGTQGMFQRVLEQIDNAKESVFVDIFWMGGTIGVQLAKTLMKKTIENPEFKVVIISDEENNFDYGIQLNVAYNYMRAYSEKFPNRYFYILPANIDLKRTALPEFVDLLFTNSTINLAKQNSQLDSIYAADKYNLIGKSDHTKVVIVDGKNPNTGTAFVGSKNWTDSSGGIATDEIAEINGPAVASILNHFYYDVLEAFLQEDKKSGYVKMQIEAKLAGEKVKSVHNGIQMLLEPIDILQRWSNTPVELVKIPYVEKGTAIISTAQNNIYGTETSTLDQNIQVILQAREQIIIDDQFLYDPYIAQALKAAIKLHGVKVYIMLESLTGTDPNVVMGHVPNNIFLPELVALGAEAKWKKVPDSVIKAIESVKTKYGETLAPEFHLKSITVDGIRANETDICNSESASLKHHRTLPALITGSANKDVMTMTGGFREYQVLVYSEDAVIRHDCIFWSRWNNPSESVETNGLDFVAPPEAKQAGLDEESFLNVLRMAFFSTYNFTKDFF